MFLVCVCVTGDLGCDVWILIVLLVSDCLPVTTCPWAPLQEVNKWRMVVRESTRMEFFLVLSHPRSRLKVF